MEHCYNCATYHSAPSQLNIWISCFSVFRSESFEFITCQYPWISVTSYFQTSSKDSLLSVSPHPFSCPPCLECFCSGVTRGGGMGRADGPGWHHPEVIPEWKKIVAEFKKNTVGRWSGDETTAKKVITLQRAMTKKGRQIFQKKYAWHRQLPPRVTPTLVTPLCLCPRSLSLLRHWRYINHVLTTYNQQHQQSITIFV